MRDQDSVQTWTQPPLFPPDVLEFTLRVGLVVSTSHGQAQCEIRDPRTGEWFHLESRHHVDPREMEVVVADYVSELMRQYERHAHPFPDDPQPV